MSAQASAAISHQISCIFPTAHATSAGGEHTALLASTAIPRLLELTASDDHDAAKAALGALSDLAVSSPALRPDVMTALTRCCVPSQQGASVAEDARLAALTALAESILPACSQGVVESEIAGSVAEAAGQVALSFLHAAVQVSTRGNFRNGKPSISGDASGRVTRFSLSDVFGLPSHIPNSRMHKA